MAVIIVELFTNKGIFNFIIPGVIWKGHVRKVLKVFSKGLD